MANSTEKPERAYARVFHCIVADDVLEKTETQTAARAAPARSVPRPVTIPPLPTDPERPRAEPERDAP